MEPYRGELKLACDGTHNVGALVNVIDYVRNSLDKTTAVSTQQKKALEYCTDLAMSKIGDFNFVPRMKLGNFKIDCLVDSGRFGDIWKAQFNAGAGDTFTVALKQMSGSVFDTSSIWKERDLLIKLKHERVVRMFGAFVETDVFLVLELCLGSVSNLRFQMDRKNATRFAVHLLEAVSWLHSNNIVHTDINADNCLINQSNKLVLSDFRSALILKHERDSVVLTAPHGSPAYLDLEANSEHKFSQRTDVFAVACILFEMDVRRYLLRYQNQVHTHELYSDALRFGRVIGLRPNVKPTKDMPRENVRTRANQSFFVHLIRKLIASPDIRLTAQKALRDETLVHILVDNYRLATNSENPCFAKEYVQDERKTFDGFFGDDEFQNPGLLTFYYDEGFVLSPETSTQSSMSVTKCSGLVANAPERDNQPSNDAPNLSSCISEQNTSDDSRNLSASISDYNTSDEEPVACTYGLLND